jgi:hypothetical protein
VTRILPLVLLAAVASAGCFSMSALVTVKPDGSGTIAQTIVVNEKTAMQFEKFAGAMAQQHGVPGSGNVPNLGELAGRELISEGMVQAMAAQMGGGVRLVSSEPLRDGVMQGRHALFAFDDIATVRLAQAGPPGTPGAQGQVTFAFEKLPNGNAAVTIRIPALSPGQMFQMPPEAASMQADPQMAAAMVGMIKPMLAGMRIDIGIAVDGRVVRSSTPVGGAGRLTLLSVDMDEMMAKSDFLKNMTPPATVEEGRRRLQNTPGVKVVMEPEIVIEFAST